MDVYVVEIKQNQGHAFAKNTTALITLSVVVQVEADNSINAISKAENWLSTVVQPTEDTQDLRACATLKSEWEESHDS